MKKTYRFELLRGEVDLTIDTELFTDSIQDEICNFWYPVLDKKIMLKRLALQLLESDFADFGVVREAREGSLNSIEGWPPLDGSYGIFLSRCSSMELDIDDMLVTELTIT